MISPKDPKVSGHCCVDAIVRAGFLPSDRFEG